MSDSPSADFAESEAPSLPRAPGNEQPLIQLNTPYLIFLGDIQRPVFAKTGLGVVQWCPEQCIGQLRFDNCGVDLGIPDLTLHEAVKSGARSVLLGVAPAGGLLPEGWLPVLEEAIAEGLDIVGGLHTRLNDIETLRTAAEAQDVRLVDVRKPPENIPIGTGRPRTGRRLLTVGTDCAVGKKYAALAIHKEMQRRGMAATFRATGQTGIMIAGRGLPMDAVVSDFLAGAAELLSPDNDAGHWDVIEGQGSLCHPSYAGVSLGLLHGSQPDAIVLCHDPSRAEISGLPGVPIPGMEQCITANLIMGRCTSPSIRCVGICLNTSELYADDRMLALSSIQSRFGVPCVDPLRDGVNSIVDALCEEYG